MKQKRTIYVSLFLFFFFLISLHRQAYAMEIKTNVVVPVYQEIEIDGQKRRMKETISIIRLFIHFISMFKMMEKVD